VYAIDIAADALLVAGRNAARHGVEERVRLIEGDLLAALPEPVDLLVSNPPYTILEEISVGVRQHEPHLALDGGPDGLAVYRRLLAQAPAKLRAHGAILLEIGATQGATVVQLGHAHFPEARISIHQDLAGLDRLVAIDTGRGKEER
jgi:release factor glutamine methyltransferase